MPCAPDRCTTSRLVGERLEPRHVEHLHTLYCDSEVMKTLGSPAALSREQTQARVDAWLEHWNAHGFGPYILSLHSGEFVGYATLHRTPIDIGEVVEIGYALRRLYWNQGYATEATKALLGIAFQAAGLREIYALTLPANIASRRVMEKSGLIYQRDFIYKDRWPSVLYRIDETRWRAGR